MPSDGDLSEKKRLAYLGALYDLTGARQAFCKIHRTHSDQPLEFSDKPYLRELINDPASLSCDIMKCVQCGVTESMIPLELAAAACGLNVMVVLPTLEQQRRYVHNRVDRPMEFVPQYRDLLKAAPDELDNVGLKAFGRGVINFASAETRRSFREIPVDALVIEEFDECDQDNLKLAIGRLDKSEYRLVIRIANPTLPETGIAKLFAAGDRREWHVTCRSCGEIQPLDWFANVVETKRDNQGQVIGYELLDREWRKGSDSEPRTYCRKCRQPIDRLERELACWKPTNPGAARRSYHMSQLMLAHVPLRRLVEEFFKALDDYGAMQVFYNERLGLAYSAPGSRLTREILVRCSKPYLMPDAARGMNAAGLDIGSRFDLRISNCPGGEVRRLLFAGKLRSRADVREVLDRYSVALVVADAKPEKHLLEEFQSELAEAAGYQRLWRCDFLPGDSLSGISYDEELGIVRVDRTWLMDKDQASYVRGNVELPRDALTLIDGEFAEELCAPERIAKRTPDGDLRYVWTKCKDHQRLASAYELLCAIIGGFHAPRVATSAEEDVITPVENGDYFR